MDDEVNHICNDIGGLKLLDLKDTIVRSNQEEKKQPFLIAGIFFNDEDGIGCHLFRNKIRAWLSVRDVEACAMTCRALRKICPTYTVQELLRDRHEQHRGHQEQGSLDSKEHYGPAGSVAMLDATPQRMSLGALVMRLVSSYESEESRPTRFVVPLGQTEKCRDKVYHPEELEKVTQIIDEYFEGYEISSSLRTLPETLVHYPHDAFSGIVRRLSRLKSLILEDSVGLETGNRILVSAFFDDMSEIICGRSAYNGTHIIKMLIRHHPTHMLVLSPAPHIRYTWWYSRLFGDPCPRVTKSLVIVWKDGDTDHLVPYLIPENTSLKLKLKIDDDIDGETEL
ncbi:hypothetical protein ACA910_007583 [Epithemia clementina (nom. ined.)]